MADAASDSTCPTCGEPVGARATYCMHCGRDLPDRAEFDDVLGGDSTDRFDDESAGGEALLSRLRSEEASIERERGAVSTSGSSTRARTRTEAERGVRSPDRSAADRSPLRRDLAAWVRPDALVQHPAAFGMGAAALALAAGLAKVAFGLSFAATGVGLAVLTLLVALAVIARRRTAFDAMRYGTITASLLAIFAPLALVAAAEGNDGPAALLLALVPAGAAGLFAAGVGPSVTGLRGDDRSR